MTAKEWLSRGYRLKAEKEQLERMREETFARLTKVTQNISGETVASTKDPHKYDILIQLDTEIEDKIRELDRVRLEIFKAIKRLPDRRYRMVLLGRYYECLPWCDIATLMHYDERQIYRFHGMALTAIEPFILRKSAKKEEAVD